MRSDISRFTFDSAKRYSSVRQQQGRVNLDADWNEQVDISRRRMEAETADVIGASGAPRDNSGFQIQTPGYPWMAGTFFALGAEIIDSNGAIQIAISPGTSGAAAPVWPTAIGSTVADGSGLVWQLVQRDVTISPGRMYVDGLLCELAAPLTPIKNFTGDGTGAAGTQVSISPSLLRDLELAPGQFVQISAQGTQAPNPQLVQIAAVNVAAGSLTFGSKITAFGAPNFNAQLQRAATYLTQPDYPSPPALPTSGAAIFYLDVWEREITALGDPNLLEIALGGPDTTTRTKTVWQVKFVDVSSVPGPVTCSTAETGIAPWERVTQSSAIQLTNGVLPSSSSGACAITSNTGFTGMENQLYRVEIHASGVYGWSAGGSYLVGAEIVDSKGNLQIATVAGVSGTAAPSWPTTVGATTTDGTVTWQLLATGFLPVWVPNKPFAVGAQVIDSNGNVETAVAAGTSGSASPAWPTGPGPSIVDGTTGLMWQYASPTFKWSRENGSVATSVTGITAVTNTAGNPASQLTVGSLGRDQVLGFTPGNWVEITDDWQDLNRQPGELHLIDSIDIAGSTITLNSPVSSTSFPTIAGNTIPSRHTRLTRWDQSGKTYLSDGATVWTDLGAAGSTGDIPVPPVGTTLLLENGITVTFSSNPVNGPLYTGDYWIFAARTADGSVEPLVQSYPHGIQHHFCRLGIVNFDAKPWTFQDCRRLFPPIADGGVHVTGVFLNSGVSLLNDSTIVLQTDLAHGINVVCDAPLDPATVTQPSSTQAVGAQATCYVSVDAPLLSSGSIIGFNPLILSANVTLDTSQSIIQWSPSSASITGLASQIAAANFPAVLAHLTLKGNFIWVQGNPHAYLQGNVLGTPYTDQSGTQHTGLQLPSGLSRRGGDFELWFWLISVPPVTLSTTNLNFGNQLVGAVSPAQTITLTNNNATSVSISMAGADPADFTQTNTCASVAVGQSCTLAVTFKPAQTGVRSAEITISSGAVQLAVVALAGSGIQPGLSASSTSLAFGVVTVGSVSAPQTVTLTNSGTASLTLTSIATTANFTQTSTCALSPNALGPGSSCTITVKFAPAQAGSLTGTLTVASNAPGSPLTVILAGTGVLKTKDSKDSKDSADSKASKDAKDTKAKLIEKAVVIEQVPPVRVVVESTGSEQPKPLEQEGSGTQKAFIQPEERPSVGQKARENPEEEEHNE